MPCRADFSPIGDSRHHMRTHFGLAECPMQIEEQALQVLPLIAVESLQVQ